MDFNAAKKILVSRVVTSVVEVLLTVQERYINQSHLFDKLTHVEKRTELKFDGKCQQRDPSFVGNLLLS